MEQDLTIRQVYIANLGPFEYDDTEQYSPVSYGGESDDTVTLRGIKTDKIYLTSSAVDDSEAVRKGDMDSGLDDVYTYVDDFEIGTTAPLTGGGYAKDDPTISINGLSGYSSNAVMGSNNAGNAIEWKSITGTANQITVTHTANTITLALDTDGDVEFDSITLGDLTASRLVASDASKKLVSVSNLASWVAGTANRITVTDDADGTITLSAPQDLHTEADVQFAEGFLTAGLRVGDPYEETSVSDNLVTGHQGVARDGTYYYVMDTNEIKKWNSSWVLQATNADPCGDVSATVNHVSDGAVYGGMLYLPIADWVAPYVGTCTEQYIALFNTSDLSYDSKHDISAQDHEVTGLCIDENAGTNGIIYICGGSTCDTIYEYDLSDFSYLGTISLSETLTWAQGITKYGGHFYISTDVFAAWPATGQIWKIEEDGTVLYPIYNANNQGYFEGLDHDGSDIAVLHDVSAADTKIHFLEPYEPSEGRARVCNDTTFLNNVSVGKTIHIGAFDENHNNMAGRIFFDEGGGENKYGFSWIYAGADDPYFDGVEFGDLSDNNLYLLRHNNSTTGSRVMSFGRTSDNAKFYGSLQLDGVIDSDGTGTGANGNQMAGDLTVAKGLNVGSATGASTGYILASDKIHSKRGSSGTTPQAYSGLVAEDDTHCAVSILTPNNCTGYLMFGDADDSYIGGIEYNHSTDIMGFQVGNSDVITFNSSGDITTAGKIVSTATGTGASGNSLAGDLIVSKGLNVGSATGAATGVIKSSGYIQSASEIIAATNLKSYNSAILNTYINYEDMVCTVKDNANIPEWVWDVANNTASNAAAFYFKRARYTTAALSSGDYIMTMFFQAYGSNNAIDANAAYMRVSVDGAPGAAIVPTKFEWYTSDTSGTSGACLVLRGDKDVEIPGKLDFTGTMGNSSKNPTADAPSDWIQVKIGGTTYYVPVYSA